MKKITTLFALMIFAFALVFSSCGPEKVKILTKEQVKEEEKGITDVIKAYINALQNKNFNPIVNLLSKEVTFYGTDQNEVIRNYDQFKAALDRQWKEWDIKYGEMTDISIQIDGAATLGTVIYGIPINFKKLSTGETTESFLRYAFVLRKEKQNWQIVSGFVGMVNPQPAATQVEKNTDAKEAPAVKK